MLSVLVSYHVRTIVPTGENDDINLKFVGM